MHPPFVGTRLPRLRDTPSLTGRLAFLADLDASRAGHVAVVRSPVGHGTIRRVAWAGPAPSGALLVGAELFGSVPGRLPVLWRLGNQRQNDSALYDGRVRYVGQPIAIVIAGDAAAAADAAAEVEVDIDPLSVATDVDAAVAPSAALLHPELGTNVLCDFHVGDDDQHVTAVLDDCAHVVRASFRIGRLAGAPMEARGILVEPDGGRVVIHTSSQAPHAVRDAVAALTGWSFDRIRVVAPAVGGGFGVKDHIYEDELMVVLASAHLGRPLRWVESRTESLTVTAQARDEQHHAEIGLGPDGRFRALRVRAVRNAGAHFANFGGGPLYAALGMMPGPYRWESYRGDGRLVATNTVPTGAYRGFGQTQAAFVRERMVDLAAASLGVDPVELRLANLIGPHEQPWTTRSEVTYDNGDYGAALRRARESVEAWPAPPADGRRRGVGYCTFVQMAGLGPSSINEVVGVAIGGYETATVRLERDGTVRVLTGITPHGQGQETTFAQLVADRLGVQPERVQLRHSDTDETPYSAYGTAASRSIAVGGGATVQATERIADKLRAIAAEMLEANPADIELVDGHAAVRGGGGSVPIVEVARRAWRGASLPAGTTPGLEETAAYDPVSCTYSYGTHACRVAVDPDTGAAEIEQYAVVHDCGTIVNPTIVEGQIHGGIAQGAGAALLEEAVVEVDGQPRTTNFADYLVPGSGFLPDVGIVHIETPSPFTPGGMKGMGEGGTNGSFACVANAIAAALPEVDVTETPLTPERIWRMLQRQTADR